jgi:hypothetical protein
MNEEEIKIKDDKYNTLCKGMEKLREIMKEELEEINNINKAEMKMMENNIKENVEIEKLRCEKLNNLIIYSKNEITKETQKELEDLKQEYNDVKAKHDNKLALYDHEISRLKKKLDDIIYWNGEDYLKKEMDKICHIMIEEGNIGNSENKKPPKMDNEQYEKTFFSKLILTPSYFDSLVDKKTY